MEKREGEPLSQLLREVVSLCSLPGPGTSPPAQLPSPPLSNLNLTPLSCLKVRGGVEKRGTPSFGVKILYFLLLGSYLPNLVKYVTYILVFPYCCKFYCSSALLM